MFPLPHDERTVSLPLWMYAANGEISGFRSWISNGVAGCREASEWCRTGIGKRSGPEGLRSQNGAIQESVFHAPVPAMPQTV